MAETILQDRRVQSRAIIDSLVQSRTETLSQYKDLMSYKPFEINTTLQEVLEDFCESMVDYTAKAHFSLYNHFEERKERRRNVLKVADSVYPKILDNTQKLLDFNDSYNSDVNDLHCERLESSLNDIGELLADRISLEDRVIAAILSNER